ncbi:MAG: homocysteine S-methyltransferase family protein [Haliangiales bacterium]
MTTNATPKTFPAQRPGVFYLTEGGLETEILYKWGFELPQFAVYPLLDNPDAMSAITGIYHRFLDIAAKYKLSVIIGGFDYRASPDWGNLLGYSATALADATLESIQWLRDVSKDYQGDIPEIWIQGYIGPRGDAYQLNRTITAEEAEDYHSPQLETLVRADVDIVCAITINNVPEATGIARAARTVGLPLNVSFTLDSNSKLKSGPSLEEAITAVDEQTDSAPAFYAINCSHPFEFEPGITPGDWIKRLRSIRPNASKMEKIALCKLGYLEEGDPVELGQLIGDLARRNPHMDIWGGCCGTGHVHLEEIVKNLPLTANQA